MAQILHIENLVNISQKIEMLVQQFSLDYIDACILYCDQYGIELEQLADLIKKNQQIKHKIQLEAERLNFLKRTPRVPI